MPVIADPARWLHKRYNRRNDQPSPIRIPGMKREKLAEWFAAFGYQCGAEIGVREGKFSEVFCKAMPGLELLCVDRWAAFPGHTDLDRLPEPGMFLEEARERLEGYRVQFMRYASMDAVREIADESLDFCYIDANHTFDFVMQDIIEWSKKVRKGGVVSGHDYARIRNFGVVPAVDVYTHQHCIHEWFLTDDRMPSWFWVKA